jgi:hypothetical protein
VVLEGVVQPIGLVQVMLMRVVYRRERGREPDLLGCVLLLLVLLLLLWHVVLGVLRAV